MSTIVKTGIVLLKRNEPTYGYLANFIEEGGKIHPGGGVHIYGDLHVVGNCCVLFYPENQVKWGMSHGWIDLDDPDMRNFQRDTKPHRILILPASRVTVRRDALHPLDLAKFQQAGGQVDTSRGELG